MVITSEDTSEITPAAITNLSNTNFLFVFSFFGGLSTLCADVEEMAKGGLTVERGNRCGGPLRRMCAGVLPGREGVRHLSAGE